MDIDEPRRTVAVEVGAWGSGRGREPDILSTRLVDQRLIAVACRLGSHLIINPGWMIVQTALLDQQPAQVINRIVTANDANQELVNLNLD